jgi:RNA polymerase sigma factor (sigma-70 family)
MTEAVVTPTATSRLRPTRLLSDDRLRRLATEGDQRAFATIYQRYHQELYRYCLAILHRPEDARDALQNTMLNALRSLPGEERRIYLKPWLYRVAHNEAITILRQRAPVAPLEEAAEPEAPSANQRLEERMRLWELVADLSLLGDRQRGALVMRELSGLSYTEIGSAFGTSSPAARQTVYEARTALHEIAGGREMDCEPVREALSASDGRILRGRKLRAHLRHCAGCRDFRAAIGRRRADLGALAPPLPAAAAAGLLHALVGSSGGTVSSGGIGLLAGSGAKTLATSGALKVGAAALATATIAVGTAEVTGVINAPFTGRHPAATRSSSPTASPSTNSADHSGAGATSIDQSGTKNGNAGNGKVSDGKKAEDNASRGRPQLRPADGAKPCAAASSSGPKPSGPARTPSTPTKEDLPRLGPTA